jgi:hypothetical protein
MGESLHSERMQHRQREANRSESFHRRSVLSQRARSVEKFKGVLLTGAVSKRPQGSPRQSGAIGAKLPGVSDVTHPNFAGAAEEAAGARLRLADQDLIEQFNRGYSCPPNAGPMWRAAWEAGVDMSLLEDALQMSPAERLREHQRALNQILTLLEARRTPEHAPRS